MEFLTFSDKLVEPSAEGSILDVLHGFSHDFLSVRRTSDNSFLNAWALADCAFFLSAKVEAQVAVPHFCRILEVMAHHYTSAFGAESWNGCHEPLHCF